MEVKGKYLVKYKYPMSIVERFKDQVQNTLLTFEGECANFCPNGSCAFSNENNEMLVVAYADIVQMSLIEEGKTNT